jgi:hypothetical protein
MVVDRELSERVEISQPSGCAPETKVAAGGDSFGAVHRVSSFYTAIPSIGTARRRSTPIAHSTRDVLRAARQPMHPLLIIAIVVSIVAFGTKPFLRRLGILLVTGFKIGAAAVLVALLFQGATWVQTLEMTDCRRGQTYVAALDACEAKAISEKDFTELLLALPDNASAEDINKAVAEYQKPTTLDRVWSHVLDWNRRRRPPETQRPEPSARNAP